MTRRQAGRLKFGGILDQPILTDPRSPEDRLQGWKLRPLEIEKRVTLERERKAELLADFYGVDLQEAVGWRNLAMALAIDVVPGFSVVDEVRGSGRPAGTRTIDRELLYFCICGLIERGEERSVAGAARRLHAEHPDFRNKSTAEGLRSLFFDEQRRQKAASARLALELEECFRALGLAGGKTVK